MINNYIALAMFLFLVIIFIWYRVYKYHEFKNYSKDKLLYNNCSKLLPIFFWILFGIFFFSFSYEVFYKFFNNKLISLQFENDLISYFIYSIFTYTFAFKYWDPVILKDDSLNNVKHEKIKKYYFKNHIFSDKEKCIIIHNLLWKIDFSFSISYLDDSQKEKLENYLISNGIEKK